MPARRHGLISGKPLNWDTSNVTKMAKMFSNASSFNQPLDNWDVSKVMNMIGMFQGSGLKEDNYCGLFTGSYSAIWTRFEGELGKSYICE